MISLEFCESITKLPDLYCPNLEKLDLGVCKNLFEVHESFGFLEKLKEWNLYSCSQLQILPSMLILKSLERFAIVDCPRLEKFPDIHPEMKCLNNFHLALSGIRELPSSLLYLTGLNWLHLTDNSKLTNFLVGANKSQMREEEDIPSAKLRLACNSFNNFSWPNLRGSPRIEVELDSWMQPDYFPVLTCLRLSRSSIVTIPESISRFTTLQQLFLGNCKKLREIPRLPQSIRTVDAMNCEQLGTQSSSRLLNQFREILGILPNTVAEDATSFDSKWPMVEFRLPVTEIPKWLKFNHRQSVGNSVSFLVGPKISNLVVCIAFPSKDVPISIFLDHRWGPSWSVHISINGKKQSLEHARNWANSNYDHVWLLYWEVNISNPSEENRIEVEVFPHSDVSIALNRMRIHVECICCPQKPNLSMDQCAFNNGEEDSGRVGIRRRLRRRNHRPTHARRPQKHFLSRFGWLRIRYRLWKPSSKPWRRRITNGLNDQGSSSIPNAFSMMIPRPILLHRLNPTLKRRELQ